MNWDSMKKIFAIQNINFLNKRIQLLVLLISLFEIPFLGVKILLVLISHEFLSFEFSWGLFKIAISNMRSQEKMFLPPPWHETTSRWQHQDKILKQQWWSRQQTVQNNAQPSLQNSHSVYSKSSVSLSVISEVTLISFTQAVKHLWTQLFLFIMCKY